MDRNEKIELLQALQERERRRRIAPLLHGNFKLTKPQRDVVEAWKSGQWRIIVFGGGNRAGKTTLLAVILVCLLYGYWIFDVPDLQLEDGDYPPRARVPPQYWIYRTDGVPLANPARLLVLSGLPFQRGIGTILWPKIEGLLTPALRQNPGWVVQRGQYSVPVRACHPNGGEVLFGSGEQAPVSFEGADYDALLNDEPIPRAFWPAVWRGLTDRHGSVLFSMTPIGANAPFVHDELLKRADSTLITGSIWSNEHMADHSKREFLAGLNCSSEERESREMGSFSLLSVRAFPTFDRAFHVVPKRDVKAGWLRICVCDPAHRRPFAFVWLARGPHGEVEIYDEHPRGVDYISLRSSTQTINDYCSMIRTSEGRHPADVRVLDPRFGKAEWSVKGQQVTSVQQDFEEFGLSFTCDVPDTGREETGIQLIRSLLAWDKNAPISAFNQPKLVVQEHCINTIAALERSTFVPPAVRDPTILDESLSENYVDFRDCVRYGVLIPLLWDSGTSDGYIDERELGRSDEYEI